MTSTTSMKQVPLIRVFLSSPSDVADERNLARTLLGMQLPYDPYLKGKVAFTVESWDNPAAPIPMSAKYTPQEAVNRGLPKPSKCDIVVVILWSRMGTRLPDEYRKPNGDRYLSGTEYEFEDAVRPGARCTVFVYRRTEKVMTDLADPGMSEKIEQYQRVEQFFQRLQNANRGFTTYESPSEFSRRLENDIKAWWANDRPPPRADPGKDPSIPVTPPQWKGSPYPGLRPFKTKESKIFFGRQRETDELIAQLRAPNCRFLAVVGTSGTGKSSLVYAGLLPRLQENAIEGSATWQVISFQPRYQGENPFLAMANELLRFLPPHKEIPIELAEELRKNPATVARYVDQVLTEKPTSARLVLFVDQLDELFTQAAENYRQKFIDLLKEAARHSHVQVLVTLREDSHAQFRQLLQSPDDLSQTAIRYSFLAPPGPAALTDMIRRPAQVAGVTLEDGVADKILEDAGNDPGALPLVAFCLNELYEESAPKGCLTLRQYQAMGGLHEAIGKLAAAAVDSISPRERDATLKTLFSKLVTVDRDGNAVRRRATPTELDGDGAVRSLVRDLSEPPGRLLTVTKETVELAHDALLDIWPMLKDWIERNRADIRLWAELAHDANNWLRSPHDNSLLWKGRKLQEARQLLKREPPYLPNNTTIDDMKRFIKASTRARWKTRAYVCLISSAVSIGLFALIMVYITPSLLPRKAMPVGSFGDTHPFGLYDVLGNVWEWTQDCFVIASEDPSTDGSAQSGNGWNSDGWCLARGGSWDNHEEWKVRASYRLPLAKNHTAPTVGFRVVRKAATKKVDGGETQETQEDINKDCERLDPDDCPKMEILPDPKQPFEVKGPKHERDGCENESPRSGQPKNTIESLAIGRFEVTVKEWNACVTSKGCKKTAFEETDGHRPITNVSWDDAQDYVQWLSEHTRKDYRLPFGAEWEYAARGNKATCRWWGNELGSGKANCAACGLTWKQFFDWFRR